MAQEHEVDLQTYLDKLLDRVPGLEALLVSDRDAVILLQVSRSEVGNKENYIAAYGAIIEQASKLQLGKNKQLTTFYADHVVVHFNHSPLIITALASATANVGLLLSLQNDLRTATEPLRTTIKKQLENFQ